MEQVSKKRFGTKTLGEVIKEKRLAAGLKVLDLAREVGVNPVYISQIEKHDKLPSQDVVERIEKALKTTELFDLFIKQKNPSLEKRFISSLSHIPSTLRKEFTTPEATKLLKFIYTTLGQAFFTETSLRIRYDRFLKTIAPEKISDDKLFNQICTIMKEMQKEKIAYWRSFSKHTKQIETLIPYHKPESK